MMTPLTYNYETIVLTKRYPSSQSHVTILDDGDPGISYSGHWASSPNPFSPSYYNDTMHRTRQAGASAEISFQGNSIEIYGATSGNHGAFAVDIDGGPSTFLNGSAAKFFPQNMLYWTDGLPTGPHTLTLWNLDSSGKYFDLDKVVVTQWIDSGSSGSGNTNNNHPAVPLPVASGTTYPHSKTKASVGTIVGSAIAGSIALILALLALYFYFRRRLRLHEMPFPGTSISDGRATRHGPMDKLTPLSATSLRCSERHL
ncbi:hypothetical protein BC629DRAFT_529107 [Irpex lacteus]|nr:hypothetical protein BC629DRAFT_529107 [Irpex lacteus]